MSHRGQRLTWKILRKKGRCDLSTLNVSETRRDMAHSFMGWDRLLKKVKSSPGWANALISTPADHTTSYPQEIVITSKKYDTKSADFAFPNLLSCDSGKENMTLHFFFAFKELACFLKGTSPKPPSST